MTTLARIEANRRNAELSTGPRTAEGKVVVARNATTHGIFAGVPVVPGESAEAWEEHRTGVVDSLAPVGLLERNLAERAALLLWRLQRLARFEAETVAADIAAVDVPPLPPPVDPYPGLDFGPKPVTRADQLRELRRGQKAAGDELAAMSPVRELFRTNPELAGTSAASAAVAEAIFHAATDHVLGRERPNDPPRFGGKVFRRGVGLPEPPQPVTWTPDVIRRGLALYGTFVGQTAEEMLVAVRAEFEERARELERRTLRLGAEAAAVAGVVDAGKRRQRAEALLPGNGRDDRIARYERHLHAMLTSTLHELERLQGRRAGDDVPAPVVADVQLTIEPVSG